MALMLLSLPKQQLKTQSSKKIGKNNDSRSSNYENFILLGDFVSDPTFVTD